jgi:hypothetical protein
VQCEIAQKRNNYTFDPNKTNILTDVDSHDIIRPEAGEMSYREEGEEIYAQR